MKITKDLRAASSTLIVPASVVWAARVVTVFALVFGFIYQDTHLALLHYLLWSMAVAMTVTYSYT